MPLKSIHCWVIKNNNYKFHLTNILYSLYIDLKEEYDIGPTDVLRYLKDHTDVRTRHAAYGKNQSISATSATIEEYGHEMDSVSLLFKVRLIIFFWFS